VRNSLKTSDVILALCNEREEIRAESEALLGKYGEALLTEEKPSVG
jgi:hypothetical protein